MFIGHFGAGLAAGAYAADTARTSRPSLGTLIMAAQWIDLIWPLLLLLGLERVAIDPGNTVLTPLDFQHYPWSHSMLAVLGWSILLGGIHYARKKSLPDAALIGGLVFSHWLLDLLVHRPDLPLIPGTDLLVGFGLWNHPAIAITLEALIFVAAVIYYARRTRATGKAGHWSLWSLVAFLALIHVSNLVSPPPPDTHAIGYVGLAQWLFVAWGYWISRTRRGT